MIDVRLNGDPDQPVHLDRSRARPVGRQLGIQNHGSRRRGLLPPRPGQDARQRRRAAACTGAHTSGDDDFEGAAFDTCKWDRTVRYDPAGIAQQGGKLHVETSAGDMLRRQRHRADQLRPPGRAGRRLDDRDRGQGAAREVLPAGRAARLRQRRRLRQVRRDRRRGRTRRGSSCAARPVTSSPTRRTASTCRIRTTTPTTCA